MKLKYGKITNQEKTSIFAKIIKMIFGKNKEEDKLKTFLNDFIQKDDIVLLKGSRGMRMERFI